MMVLTRPPWKEWGFGITHTYDDYDMCRYTKIWIGPWIIYWNHSDPSDRWQNRLARAVGAKRHD